MQLFTNYSHPRILSQLIEYSLGPKRSAVAGGVSQVEFVRININGDLPLGLKKEVWWINPVKQGVTSLCCVVWSLAGVRSCAWSVRLRSLGSPRAHCWRRARRRPTDTPALATSHLLSILYWLTILVSWFRRFFQNQFRFFLHVWLLPYVCKLYGRRVTHI